MSCQKLYCIQQESRSPSRPWHYLALSAPPPLTSPPPPPPQHSLLRRVRCRGHTKPSLHRGQGRLVDLLARSRASHSSVKQCSFSASLSWQMTGLDNWQIKGKACLACARSLLYPTPRQPPATLRCHPHPASLTCHPDGTLET